MSYRRFLAPLMAVALVVAPVGAVPRALGMVVQTQDARIGGGEALVGATLFSGETVSTMQAGNIRIRMAGAQFYLQANSAATFDEDRGWNVASLSRGVAGFSTTGDEHVVVRSLGGVQVYPSSNEPTHGEVAVVGSNELLVTSYRGPLEVMVDGEVHAVPSSSAYRVLLEQPPQDVEGVGRAEAHRAKVVGVVVGTTIIAAVITLVLLKNAISPSIP